MRGLRRFGALLAAFVALIVVVAFAVFLYKGLGPVAVIIWVLALVGIAALVVSGGAGPGS